MTQVYQQIARSFGAWLNCLERDVKTDWEDKHFEEIEELVTEYFPSGSGFDAGTTFDFSASKPNRLVFNTSFHHMTEHGYYDGWTEHAVIVTPDLRFGFDLRVTGRNRNDTKEYIGECFDYALSEYVEKEDREAVA